MAFGGQKGQRLLASVIDAYAVNDPHRVWATAPVDNENLTQGYRDISYKDFRNAIDRASWWLKGKTSSNAQRVRVLQWLRCCHASEEHLRNLRVLAENRAVQSLTPPFLTTKIPCYLWGEARVWCS